MKTNESITSNLKSEIPIQIAKTGVYSQGGDSAIEAMKEINKYNRELGESKKKKDETIIRKPFKKGVSDNLVGNIKMDKPIGQLFSIGKSESNEATSASGAGQFSTPLFTTTKKEMEEKWSQKYKDSIDCNNPKGFSQKAHCQGKKKKQVSEEILKGGKADKKTFEDLVVKNKQKGKDIKVVEKELKKQLKKGVKIEMEHSDDKEIAKEIALDHLFEDPNYYDKLEKIETKEATGASSAGAYVTPAAWSKSMSKKDWRGASKTQIPGGKFVQVKKKCKKFPYCNQGDIKALKIFENETLQKVISNISQKHNISENVIKTIIAYEYENNRFNITK